MQLTAKKYIIKRRTKTRILEPLALVRKDNTVHTTAVRNVY